MVTSNLATIDISPGFTRLGAGPKLLSTGQYVDVQVGLVQAGEPGSGLGYSITCGGGASAWNGAWAVAYYRGAALPTAGSWGAVSTTTTVVAPAATAVYATAMLVECLGGAISSNKSSTLAVSSPVTSRVSQAATGSPNSKVAIGDQQLAAAGSTGTRTTTLTTAQALGAAGLTFVLEPVAQTVAIGQAAHRDTGRRVVPPVTDYPSLIQNSDPAVWFRMDSDDGYNSGSTYPTVRGVFNDSTGTGTDHSYVGGLTKGSARALRGRGVSWSSSSVSDVVSWSTAQPVVYEGLLLAGEDITGPSFWDVANLSEFRLSIQYGLLVINYYDATGAWTSYTVPGSLGSGFTHMITVTYGGAAVGSTCPLKLYLDGSLVASLTAKVNAATITSFRVGGGGNAVYVTWDEQQIYLNPVMTNWTDVQIGNRWTQAKPALTPSPQSPSVARVVERELGQVVKSLTAFKINRAVERDLSRTVARPGAGPQAMEINAAKSTDVARTIVTPIQNYVDLLSRKPPTFWFSMDSTTAVNQGATAATIPGTWNAGVFGPSFVAGITLGSSKATSTSGGGYWKVTSGVDVTQPFAMEGLVQAPSTPPTANQNKPQVMAISGLFTLLWSTNGALTISFVDNTFVGGANNSATTSQTWVDGKPHLVTVTGTGAAVTASSTLSLYVDGVLVKTITTARIPASFVQATFGDTGGSATAFTGVFDEFNLTTPADLANDWTQPQISTRWDYAKTPPPKQSVTLGRATEVASSRPVGLSLGILRATVGSSARILGRALGVVRASEADGSRVITPVSQAAARAFPIGAAIETGVGRTVTASPGAVARTIGRATQGLAARAIGAGLGIMRAVEADSSRVATPTPGVVAVEVVRASETDLPEEIAPAITGGSAAQSVVVGLALDRNLSRVIKVKKAMIGHRAYEDATFSW
ncbi:MAG: hypothetical protein HOV97_05000 [Nonomuraea sp.]|nr:hypothetical protein [Nonomuraea sp.]